MELDQRWRLANFEIIRNFKNAWKWGGEGAESVIPVPVPKSLTLSPSPSTSPSPTDAGNQIPSPLDFSIHYGRLEALDEDTFVISISSLLPFIFVIFLPKFFYKPHNRKYKANKPMQHAGRFTMGQAALKAVSCKVMKHEKACIENQHVFIPFVFDTFGFLATEAVDLLNRVQRVMHSNVMTPKSMDVVFKRELNKPEDSFKHNNKLGDTKSSHD
ncbi:hypothetical protein LXL04_011484 [Taraxacum kok-saghyz]